MKRALLCLFASMLALAACDGSGGDDAGADGGDDNDGACDGELNVTAPADGYIYLDGTYAGQETPGPIPLPIGEHRIGVGMFDSAYLTAEFEIDDSTCEISLDQTDTLAPTIWRALWIGVPDAEADLGVEVCATHASADDLDAAFAFFENSLRDQVERFAFHTLAWEIDRQDTTVPITVTGSGDWYDVQPSDVAEVWDGVALGDYDAIFVFWKSQGDGCVIPGGYLGLGWSPQPATKQSGFVTVKFETDDIPGLIDYFEASDPGPWTHEWLHTVSEAFYPNLGAPLPTPGGDGLVVHGAEDHGYSFPWMTWYDDLIGGRVPEDGGFRGIGPEALSACTVREVALDPGGCQLP